ncbi:RBBP9/YdeN family alpha/beta hydrolase [Xanthobacter sp. TB0136]|uniref:RBBP9/YdeN family alpha/beta hydrolase n=1 Tax=Xanthobacter sp. TB0136 TaxID=3459177 RepID=UPI004039A28C
MKSSEATILIAPGWNDSGPDHWQSRWQEKLSTARRVEQKDFSRPDLADWTDQLVKAVEAAPRPVVLVAHSLGTTTLLHAAPRLRIGKGAGQLAGAFLVAPPDLDCATTDPALSAFAPVPMQKLPCPAVVVASRTDPFCSYERAQAFAAAWGAALVDAGDAGHINPPAGFGPWPEGTMRFMGFIRSL